MASTAAASQSHRSCPRCRTSSYANSKSLRLMITECGHSLCSNCLEVLFAQRAAGLCHVCKRAVRKNGYWEQTFDDPMIEKEVFWRKKIKKMLNPQEGDFADLRAYNDYLERLESLICSLTSDSEAEATKNELDEMVQEYETVTSKNRSKKSHDELWVQQQLHEDDLFRHRLADYNKLDQQQSASGKGGGAGGPEGGGGAKASVEDDARGLIEELKSSDLPAELILDQRRKRKIEAELAAREENKKRVKMAQESKPKPTGAYARHQTGRGGVEAMRDDGVPYRYVAVQLGLVLAQPPPDMHLLGEAGFLKHMRQPSNAQRAGGYRAELGCYRALLDARCDIIAA